MHDQIVTLLNQKIPQASATVEKKEVGDLAIVVDAAHILAVGKILKTDPSLQFNVLQAVTGCDYADRIEVSYILARFQTAPYDLIVKVKLPRENPEVASVVPLWKSANFQERECFDMLGVKFLNHPDLRRILCPEDWEGFPLRKDYVVAKVYRNMEVNPPHKMNFPEREFAEKQKKLNRAAAGGSSGEQSVE